MAKKYYAVLKGVKPGIYETWDECKEQTNGFSGAVYKSFTVLKDAISFLEGNSTVEVDVDNFEELKDPYAYVDGSFNKETNTYGFGVYLVVDGKEHVLQGSGNILEKASMRNVAGEIDGALAAVNKALQLGLKEINIYYDYQGIESWATLAWKTNNVFTSEYSYFMQSLMDQIRVNFIKVKGHTGIHGNEVADKLAKEAVGL